MLIPANVRETADEFYAFDGGDSLNRRAWNPVTTVADPYWVARHGLTVTERIGHGPVERIESATVEQARAAFAMATHEMDGPAAPQVGDVIRCFYTFPRDEEFEVQSVTTREGEFFVAGSPTGVTRRLAHGRYQILSRPAS